MNKAVIATLALILFATAIGIHTISEKRNQPTIATITVQEIDPKVSEIIRLKKFFDKHETLNAEEWASALLLVSPSYRDILSQILVIETNGDHTAVGSSGEEGGFQIRSKFWGTVPSTIAAQVQQAAYVYATLYAIHGSEYRTVRAYNGKGYAADKYAYAVLALKGE